MFKIMVVMSERLRSQTANLVGIARAGSNPAYNANLRNIIVPQLKKEKQHF